MIKLKSAYDIERLAEGGAILARILDDLEKHVVAGIASLELEKLARKLLADHNVEPAFLNYGPRGHDPFPAALCVSVNDAVVHGIPSQDVFRNGDVVGLDFGLIFQKKYYLDSARTVIVGQGTPESERLVAVTKKSLAIGIAAAQIGNTIGDIGFAIQDYVEKNGFNVVRELVGHGVGFAVHEDPQVPNFGRAGTGIKLQPGLVIAIEPMVTIGNSAVVTGDDDWAVKTKSGQLSAHQEHTIAITENGPRVLTK